jgi:hypothetical protein
LIRRGLEKLEQEPHEVVVVAPENLPGETVSEFVAVDLIPIDQLDAETPPSEGHVLAYRQWIPHPRETVAVRLRDDAMAPILPVGSVVAIDRSVRDPAALQGRMVAAASESDPVIRWLDVAGRHLILRPNQPSREFPMIPIELRGPDEAALLGQVVWSWSRFTGA